MTFDPDKVKRWDLGTTCKSWMENVANRSEVDIKDDTYVRSEDYDALLQLYREEQVKSANLVFLEQTDAAITESQAKTIKRLMGEKNG